MLLYMQDKKVQETCYYTPTHYDLDSENFC